LCRSRQDLGDGHSSQISGISGGAFAVGVLLGEGAFCDRVLRTNIGRCQDLSHSPPTGTLHERTTLKLNFDALLLGQTTWQESGRRNGHDQGHTPRQSEPDTRMGYCGVCPPGAHPTCGRYNNARRKQNTRRLGASTVARGRKTCGTSACRPVQAARATSVRIWGCLCPTPSAVCTLAPHPGSQLGQVQRNMNAAPAPVQG
jgi:hypothetical protein